MAAAAAVAGTQHSDVFGSRRVVSVRVAVPADAETFTFNGLPEGIAWATVTHESDAAVAADAISIASISGNTVTFQVVGTARDARVVAYGNSAVAGPV